MTTTETKSKVLLKQKILKGAKLRLRVQIYKQAVQYQYFTYLIYKVNRL